MISFPSSSPLPRFQAIDDAAAAAAKVAASEAEMANLAVVAGIKK